MITKLEKCSPLVFAGEVRTLQEELAKASMGQGFLLMGRDCTEAFNEFSVNHIRDTCRGTLLVAHCPLLKLAAWRANLRNLAQILRKLSMELLFLRIVVTSLMAKKSA